MVRSIYFPSIPQLAVRWKLGARWARDASVVCHVIALPPVYSRVERGVTRWKSGARLVRCPVGVRIALPPRGRMRALEQTACTHAHARWRTTAPRASAVLPTEAHTPSHLSTLRHRYGRGVRAERRCLLGQRWWLLVGASDRRWRFEHPPHAGKAVVLGRACGHRRS